MSKMLKFLSEGFVKKFFIRYCLPVLWIYILIDCIQSTFSILDYFSKPEMDYYGIPVENEENKNDENNILYTIQVGAFKNKNNAEKYLVELKKSGIEGIIIQKTK